ncbi:MAG: polyprenyl synthetase family protein [Lachnospiraceae bacterium]|nr:polyprenyl synthetase family protein [Lachnospiraceae bacterium]
MEFQAELKQKVGYIQEVIRKYLPIEEGMQKTVIEAMNYSVMGGGKRIRPLLMLETYRLFNGKNQDDVEPFMAAMEFIHTYSLVHDDLPAMDDDEYRRGRKTTHVMFGEAMGILAGDALLNYSYEVVSSAVMKSSNTVLAARAMTILSQKSGIYGMLGGQVVDVENEGQPLSKEKIEFIHELKTGALIEASMMIGAILAGCSKEQVLVVRRIGQQIGLAFQIQDDILDVVGDEQKLGKPVKSDEKNNKTTYVSLVGVEKAKREVERLSNNAIETLQRFQVRNIFLEELVKHLISRDK